MCFILEYELQHINIINMMTHARFSNCHWVTQILYVARDPHGSTLGYRRSHPHPYPEVYPYPQREYEFYHG